MQQHPAEREEESTAVPYQLVRWVGLGTPDEVWLAVLGRAVQGCLAEVRVLCCHVSSSHTHQHLPSHTAIREGRTLLRAVSYLSNSEVAQSACQSEWSHSIPVLCIHVCLEVVEEGEQQRQARQAWRGRGSK